ncbi:MAG: hypothetical protein ACXW30_02815 [Micavibrio sp.]
MGKSSKTSKASLAIAGVFGAALLGGIWAFHTNPDISDKLTDPEDARRVLVNADLKPITVGGYSPLGCSRGEWFATRFTAENPQGKIVPGTVCKTIFGRSRLSFD